MTPFDEAKLVQIDSDGYDFEIRINETHENSLTRIFNEAINKLINLLLDGRHGCILYETEDGDFTLADGVFDYIGDKSEDGFYIELNEDLLQALRIKYE